MTRERIIVIMGSKSDLHFAKRIGDFLRKEGFTVNCEYVVSSAHRTPEVLLNKLKKHRDLDANIVYVTIAGLSDALSGVVAGFSTNPVIACPPDVDKFGLTKVFSSAMTPTGVPVLFVFKPENAALAAVRILSFSAPSLRRQMEKYLQKKREAVVEADNEISHQNV